MHGILDSSDIFFVNQKQSIGQTLLDMNYDVWLINFRGNKYSHKHKYLDENSFEFWDFSFDEMGIYDLKAAFDFIYSIKK